MMGDDIWFIENNKPVKQAECSVCLTDLLKKRSRVAAKAAWKKENLCEKASRQQRRNTDVWVVKILTMFSWSACDISIKEKYFEIHVKEFDLEDEIEL